MSTHLKQYLQYIVNTGGNATVANFDEDWEPIGPSLRREMVPRYAEERDGFLFLTDEGKALLVGEVQG